MIIYNVLINDRHCDPEIYNFRDKKVACDFAINKAYEYCQSPEDIETTEEKEIDGWILFIQYSCEGDYVQVTKGALK